MDFTDQFGKLLLPTEPDELVRQFCWGDCLFNRLAVLVCILIFIVSMADLFRLIPSLMDCLTMRRGHASLEHNIRFARSRNAFFWLFLLAFSLIVDYYKLYPAEYFEKIPVGWSAGALMVMMALYTLVRFLLYSSSSPRYLRGDEQRAAENAQKTYMIFLVTVWILSIGILKLFRIDIAICQRVLYIELGLFFAISTIKVARILGSVCNVFSTFLYLCALEFAPAAVIVASAIVY